MCGRYALYGPQSRLRETFELDQCADFAPRWNITPLSEIPVVRQRPDGSRAAMPVRWGLVPRWAKDPSIAAKLNNARAETVAEKPSFRDSFRRHRCLIPASGFYEWQARQRDGKAFRQPWFIHPEADGALFAFAGLVARWVGPDGQDLVTTCVITTGANALMAPIHDRMPVIVAPADFAAWLAPANQDVAALQALLRPAPVAGMRADPVSLAVNRAGNEGPQLVEPVAPEGRPVGEPE